MILDTNALSAFIDGEPAVGARLSSETHVAIPVIVLGEFRYGIAGSPMLPIVADNLVVGGVERLCHDVHEHFAPAGRGLRHLDLPEALQRPVAADGHGFHDDYFARMR